MNDFTKDELNLLLDALTLWNLKHICSDMRDVQFKIQSMIDNYQEPTYKVIQNKEVIHEDENPKCPICSKSQTFGIFGMNGEWVKGYSCRQCVLLSGLSE